MALAHAGFGEFIHTEDIVSITVPNSAPIQRMIKDAKREKRAIDFSGGRRTKAVVFLESGKVALVAITPEALAGRVNSARTGKHDQALA